MVGRRRAAVWFALAATAGGCAVDPAAPLIPTPQRPATVAPSQAPVRTADGFPNILADPVVVGGGLPRPQRAIDAEVATLAAERQEAQAATRAIPRTGFTADLARRATTSVADARAQIAASGRTNSAAAAPTPDPQAAIAAARAEIEASGARGIAPSAAALPGELDEARPIDPDAPLPRAVGPTP